MKYQDDPTFCAVIPHILNSEGKYTNNPHDSGGPTMFGVAWNYNVEYLTGIGLTHDTVRNLTLDQAKQIYFDKYYRASSGTGITDTDLAYIHLDAAINCGTGQAMTFLSRLSHNPKNYDFSGGKNRTLAMSLFLEYTAQRLKFYTHCKERDHFLAGWINRMSDVITNSLNMD